MNIVDVELFHSVLLPAMNRASSSVFLSFLFFFPVHTGRNIIATVCLQERLSFGDSEYHGETWSALPYAQTDRRANVF